MPKQPSQQTFMESLRSPWIRQNSIKKQCWDVFLLSLVVYTLGVVPLELGFGSSASGNSAAAPEYIFSSNVVETVDLFTDVCFFVDMLINFICSKYNKLGEEVTDMHYIRIKYLRSYFAIDLVSSIPFDMIFSAGKFNVLKVLKIPRLLRVTRVFKAMEHLSVAVVWRMVKLAFTVLISIHCLVGLMGFLVELDDSTWLQSQPSHYVSYWPTRYLICFHMVVSMAFGGSMNPTNIAELTFEPFVIFCGAAIQAGIIGCVAMIMANLNAREFAYREQMDHVNDSMRGMQIDDELAHDVRAFFDYSYAVNGTVDGPRDQWLEHLSPELRARMLINKYSQFIMRVPLFAACVNTAYIGALLRTISTQIFTPREFIYKEGSPGSEMFFVLKGSVLIVSQGTIRFLKVKEKGYFGEMALVEPLHTRPRTAESMGFTYVAVLSRAAVSLVHDKYQEEKKIFQNIADMVAANAYSKDLSKIAAQARRNFKPVSRSGRIDVIDLRGKYAVSPTSGASASVKPYDDGEDLTESLLQGDYDELDNNPEEEFFEVPNPDDDD